MVFQKVKSSSSPQIILVNVKCILVSKDESKLIARKETTWRNNGNFVLFSSKKCECDSKNVVCRDVCH
jgi:hypothetical protein